MKIEIKSSPRYQGAPPEDCVQTLLVNGYILGTYYGGKEKKYENPEKWAKSMAPKRLKVLHRNIARLEKELQALKNEQIAIGTPHSSK